MKATASGVRRAIEVMSHSNAWSFDVEAVKESRTFPEDAKFIVKSRLTSAHMTALRA